MSGGYIEQKPAGIKEYREFALTVGAAIGVVFGGIIPWIFERSYPVWPWALGGLLAIWGLVAPATLRYPYAGWMKLGLLIGKVTTPIVMIIIFGFLITPLGLLMRLFGARPLDKKYQSDSSFRLPSAAAGKDGLERPF